MATDASRPSPRVLNYGSGPPDDGHEREWDVCPDCGNKRWQLIIVPDRFHCDHCRRAGPGPNREVREAEPEQTDITDLMAGSERPAWADTEVQTVDSSETRHA